MNARTKSELVLAEARYSAFAEPSQVVHQQDRSGSGESVAERHGMKRSPVQNEENPVIRHLDQLQGQLSQQLDSLDSVIASMQRISEIMDRMAMKRCTLNSGAALVDPAKRG